MKNFMEKVRNILKKYRGKRLIKRTLKIIFLYVTPIFLIFYIANSDINKTPPCEEIILYKIGVFDPRFGITKEEFKNDIDQAVNLWRKVFGYTLFKYDPQADLTINLIYDERQEITQKEQVLNIESNKDVINNNELLKTGFNEGSYISDKDGTKIDLYQYENKTDFILLLAHELGHAIGLDHNNNKDSIMYFQDGKRDFALSPEDIQDLKKRCEIQ